MDSTAQAATTREVLGWMPVEDTPSLLEHLVDVYAEEPEGA